MKLTDLIEEKQEEFRNKILDIETAVRLTYNELDADGMIEKMLREQATSITIAYEAGQQAERERIVVQLQRKGYDRDFAEKFIGVDSKMNITPTPPTTEDLSDSK